MKQINLHNREWDKMKIISYQENYKKDFVRLNLLWIKKYFKVEPQDVEMLNDVEDFLAKGAAVYFAVEQDRAIAACMVVPREGRIWEICKLATDEHHMGKGAGSAVLKACIDYAKEHGAEKLMIVSNTVLSAAMHLYAKAGFKEVPIDNMEYERVNIQLELNV
ncbi:GNAT family N-acetyltransferase [Lacrimispora sp. NSJ-141]|uniref:GNAT family N-acetyltransferase n=1 Tax=Lientehia hominis TaxID=2897778 RepID=A0AAP2RL50_9FIRM|nr:GNAT family N-acetyltransferase [Lientehia hominis]MCD2492990.1 GNAT family N-acetyltransferase [Lientehia hominis]